MNPYICVTYAHDDRQQSELFCRSLNRYGFRYSCINELSTIDRRGDILAQSSLLIALTSEAAVRVETVASDIRRAMERGIPVLCISLKANELDHRFCTGTEGSAVLIPFPAEDTPDHHALALFVHRLYVRHLARLSECFVESRCDENVYGQLIRCAYYAHAGDNDACFELGRAYELGLGVPALEKEAAIWMKRAADGDVCDALIHMGRFYLTGTGIERNPEEAFRLFTRAARQGDLRGIYRRGLCYLEGHGVMKDPIHAIECLTQAATAQHAPSLYRLAILYRDGIGTERDWKTALKYLYAVCCRGYGKEEHIAITPPLSVFRRVKNTRYACITMRQMRHTRLSGLVRSTAKRGSLSSADRIFGRNTIRTAVLPEDRWEHSMQELYSPSDHKSPDKQNLNRNDPHAAIYESEWSRADAALAAFDLGCLLAAGDEEQGISPSPTRALVWYRYAARLGHTEALYALGDAYRRGFGTPANIGRAVELFRLAAEGGSERGQFAYAVCFEQGIGVAVDHREAFRFYEQAAVVGYPPAQNNLGGCYEYGIGVPQNMVAAVECYASAANAGQADGQCRLGICYELGRGVPVDHDKAIRLYELAADSGHAYALYRRALCYDRDRRVLPAEENEENILMTEALEEEDYAEEDDLRDPLFPRPEDERNIHTIDHSRAADLYRRAADAGVPEAAYAYYLCHRLERGLSRDEREEIRYLRMAAEGGSLQATYELGLCCMEGSGLPKDQSAAVRLFAQAVELWRALSEDARIMAQLSELEGLPPDALTPRQAAGGALYMLAYCTLYGLGDTEDNREIRLPARPDPQRVKSAAELLREAAGIDHVGSFVMLGDLYSHGLLISTTATAQDEAQGYYLEAVRAETAQIGAEEHTRGTLLRDPTNNTIDARLSLAEQALQSAEQESDRGSAELSRVSAWHFYSECAARGSVDALVAMAHCLYFGLGTSPNPDAAVRLLQSASERDGGRVTAALWLGDFLSSPWGGSRQIREADQVYLHGLELPCLESESGAYTLGPRRTKRKQADIRSRAEILYRLATLRAVHDPDPAKDNRSFRYLAEAILLGHTAARDDLARMYDVGSKPAPTPESDPPHGKLPRSKRKDKLRHRIQESGEVLDRDSRAARTHQEWLSNYYSALCPEPEPFSYTMKNTAVPDHAPEYVTVPVTDVMRVGALHYLGECFFEGYGLPADATAAVACYRAALDCAPRGGPNPPAAVVEATYSLGWCLLHGVGTTVDYRAAIRLLTSVSRSHPGACFTLGLCHEEGLGVVAADDREAIKFYRKAQRLGHPNAAEKVAAIEKRLQAGNSAL